MKWLRWFLPARRECQGRAGLFSLITGCPSSQKSRVMHVFLPILHLFFKFYSLVPISESSMSASVPAISCPPPLLPHTGTHTPFSSPVLGNLSSGSDGGGPRRFLVLFWKHPARSLCVTCLLIPQSAAVLASWYYHLWPNQIRVTTGPRFPRTFLALALRSHTQRSPLIPDTPGRGHHSRGSP